MATPVALGVTTASPCPNATAKQNFYHPQGFCLDHDLHLPPNTWIIVQCNTTGLDTDQPLGSGFTMQRLLHRQILHMPWVRLNLAVGNLHKEEDKKWIAGTTLDHIVNQPHTTSCLLLMPTSTDRTLHALDFM
jgi:hypothetical protein